MILKDKITDMVWSQIGKPSKDMVLATVNGNVVAARTVSFVPHNNKLYFLTCSESNKGRQMKANQNVALCVEALRIEGTAKILGHPFAKESEELFKVLAPAMPWAGQYKDVPTTVIVEISPALFNVVEIRGESPVELVLDLKSGEAKEVLY